MIAVNKSKRKPHVSDIHSNHRTTLHCHFGFPSPLLPLQTGEKTYSILMLLNCMTSSMPGTKSRGGNMHIEEELCAKFFYYVYLCKWHIRLFKKSLRCSSSCCPLVRLSAAICTQSGSSQSPWLVFFYYKNYIKRGNGGFIVLLWHSSKLKMREWWILQSFPNIISISVPMLMNFGCLRLRWTPLSRLSPSSSSIPLYLIFSTLHIK